MNTNETQLLNSMLALAALSANISPDAERLRRCHKRALAIDSALKCLIAEYPAAALRITLMLLPDTTEPE